MTLQIALNDIASGKNLITVQVPDQATADAWIAKASSSNIWGKPDRWLTEVVDLIHGEITVPGEDITKATETRVITIKPAIAAVAASPAVLDAQGAVITPAVIASDAVPAVTITQAHFAPEYEIVQTDVSAQVDQEKAIAAALSRQNVGAGLIAAIFTMNEAKLAAGTLNTATLEAMMADSAVTLIRELLWAGSLTTAKALITAYNGVYFTAADKAAILALMAAY
jgi:hypothetical protein